MPIPAFQDIMLPLLRLCGDGKEWSTRLARDPLAEHFQLTREERSQMLPSGYSTVFNNRVAWAKIYLERAGLLTQLRRAWFKISEQGLAVLRNSPERLDTAFLEQFGAYQTWRSRSATESRESTTPESEETPEEQLQNAHSRLTDDLAKRLLSQIGEMSPEFFERLVLDLMLAMGYGGQRSEAGALTDAGADGGIDGIINEDKLGLDTIYLQAKRWQNTVGRPEIHKFVGALHGCRARKGVFLTTSTFSRDAVEYAEQIDTKVVLIDGMRLAELMIAHNVGCTPTQTFVIKRIDSDYFADE
jgi:restriction system protein